MNAESGYRQLFAKTDFKIKRKNIIILFQITSHYSLSIKLRQSIIDDINFLVYRTSFHFLDKDPHKKVHFVLTTITMS